MWLERSIGDDFANTNERVADIVVHIANILLPILVIGRLLNLKRSNGGEAESSDEAGDGRIEFGSQIPFGPMLAVGGLVYFLGFSKYVDAYFENFVSIFMNR